MLVENVSQLTGKQNMMELNVTIEQMEKYMRGEGHVQTIFAHLKPEEREFLISGITPEEWTQCFGKA